ncbi:MAG: laccase domain-containing protein, partial [Plesiomonas shigelloides]
MNWIEPDWPAPAKVRALSTTRDGGMSEGPYASLNLGSHVGDSL